MSTPLDLQIYTVPEVAKLLKTNQATILGYIHDGLLVASNTARGNRPRWKVTAQAIRDYLESTSTKATAKPNPKPRRQLPTVKNYV